MVQLLLSGCNGRMGHAVEAICAAEPELELTAGFDLLGADIRDFPVYASPAEFQGEADVVVDFSSPSALPALLSFGLEHRMPLVLATTGYDQGQLEEIQQAARSIPIFRSANLSLGVNILVELVRRTAAVLGGSIWIQIVVFLVLSGLSLALIRPFAARLLKTSRTPTNADRVIGKTAVVTEAIDNVEGKGQVNVSGQVWSARSEHDVVIPTGTEVRVLRIEGVKLFVEAL